MKTKMEIKEIIEVVETRFLPLISNINSSLNFKFGELNIDLTSSYVHVYYNPFSKNQFTCHNNNEWSSVQFCPNHLTEDDTSFIYAALDNIYDNQIKGSKLLQSKGEQLTNKIKELENELDQWQKNQN